MEWHTVEIEKLGSTVTWSIDSLLITTMDLNTVTLGGGNIFFGHSDINSTSSTDPNDSALLFTLIDNIVVVPTPGAGALLTAAGFGVLFSRRRTAR